MALYSSGVNVTEIIEPVIDSKNDRVEFKIPSGVVTNNLRLANIGVFGNANNTYNKSVGSLGQIENIYLYDGRTELDAQRSYNKCKSFKNLLQNNSSNAEIERLIQGHEIGYSNCYDATSIEKTRVKNLVNTALDTSDASASPNRGLLDLRKVFNLLQQLPALDSNIFKDLRVVIEYSSSLMNVVQVNNQLAGVQSCRPLLIVDRIVDQSTQQALRSQIQNTSFISYEYDRVLLPAVANNDTSSVQRKLLGFNGKKVNRLRLAKEFNNDASNINGNTSVAFGNFNSHNVNGFKVQYRVNGRSVLPRDGITGSNRRLAMTVDTMGDLNIYPDAVQPLVKVGFAGNLGDDFRGKQDYDAIFVNEKITDLQINLDRSGTTDTTTPSANQDEMRILVEAEVEKALMIGNGSYRVMYV